MEYLKGKWPQIEVPLGSLKAQKAPGWFTALKLWIPQKKEKGKLASVKRGALLWISATCGISKE
ncbi:MAG TPA: hypothetical protein VHZ28_03915 [Terracidiphilus sp.]|jgi:hypothetical protein|nr:hypothetical protein [Terracidiphilus sp.]